MCSFSTIYFTQHTYNSNVNIEYGFMFNKKGLEDSLWECVRACAVYLRL